MGEKLYAENSTHRFGPTFALNKPRRGASEGLEGSAMAPPEAAFWDLLTRELETMREIFRQKPVDLWELGRHANIVEDLRRARRFGSSGGFFRKHLPEIPASTLYRCGLVARYFSRDNLEKWGITKLELLVAYDMKVHGEVRTGELGDEEIQLRQEDGSTTVKKFCDCSASELRTVTEHRRLKRKPKPEAVPPPQSAPDFYSLPILTLFLGALLVVIRMRLPSTPVSSWSLWIGAGLIGIGLFLLVRSLRRPTEQ
jgi:hypothetical protein